MYNQIKEKFKNKIEEVDDNIEELRKKCFEKKIYKAEFLEKKINELNEKITNGKFKAEEENKILKDIKLMKETMIYVE